MTLAVTSFRRGSLSEPVFLCAAEQSGTTLLRIMLDSHPEVAFAEEFHYAVDPIGPDGRFPTTAEFGTHLDVDRSFASSGFRFDPDLDFEDMVKGFLASRQRRASALVVGATLHRNFSRALHLWPNARFLHLVRDPRDVAANRLALGLSGNPWHAVQPWVEVADEWSALVEQVPEDRRLTIRFGDLIQDHHSTLTGICRFLGIDYTGHMLDYVHDTDYREPDPDLAGDWRDALSARDVRLVEGRVGHRLVANGFVPSCLDELTLSKPYTSWLRWHDRAGRTRGQVQRVGLRLTAADLAARAVGHQTMQRAVQRRLDQAEKDLRKKSWSDAKYRTSR